MLLDVLVSAPRPPPKGGGHTTIEVHTPTSIDVTTGDYTTNYITITGNYRLQVN